MFSETAQMRGLSRQGRREAFFSVFGLLYGLVSFPTGLVLWDGRLGARLGRDGRRGALFSLSLDIL